MIKGVRTQFLMVLVVALAAMGATAQGVDVQFYWEQCPQVGEYGVGMGDPVVYRLYQSSNDGPEQLVAVSTDTLVSLTVDSGTLVKFRVQGVDELGTASVKSDWSEPLYYEVSDDGPPRPAHLRPNYPNPFNPETTLSYLVPEDMGKGDRIALEVFTVRGLKVRTLEVERTPGWHQIRWDGRDDFGQQAASGTYLSRYMAGTMVETGKMTMLK